MLRHCGLLRQGYLAQQLKAAVPCPGRPWGRMLREVLGGGSSDAARRARALRAPLCAALSSRRVRSVRRCCWWEDRRLLEGSGCSAGAAQWCECRSGGQRRCRRRRGQLGERLPTRRGTECTQLLVSLSGEESSVWVPG